MSDLNQNELTTKAELMRSEAMAVKVQNNGDFEDAGYMRREIKTTMQKITAYWKPKKEQAHQLHKSLVAAEKDMLQPLEAADKIIDAEMLGYHREQEKIRLDAQRERERLEAEAQRKTAELERMADEAARADELDNDDVEILRMAQTEADTAQHDVAVAYVPDKATAPGISVRKVWKAKVVKDFLVPVSVAGIMIRPVDEKMLNKLAVATEGNVICPGVEFYQEESSRLRL